MKQAILFLLLLLSASVHAQLEISTLTHDFGDLEAYDNKFVDIQLTNKGSKQEYILRVKKEMEVVYISSSQFVESGGVTTLRFQVNPNKKGRFNYLVEIYTSDRQTAFELKLKGNLKDLSVNSGNGLTSCPDFNAHPANRKPNNFDLTVITIDKSTKEELAQTKVSMIQNGRAIWTEKTNDKGKIKKEANLGLSYFYASLESYKPAELGAYVNTTRNVVVLELEKDPSYCPPVPVDRQRPVIAEKPEELNLEEQLANEVVPFIEAPVEMSSLNPDNFEENYFNVINVVFVLDVSGSMKQGDKMELMKYSLIQLSEMLRSQDKMGIVTYATDTKVILNPTSGSSKSTINNEIEKLKAEGLTAGGKGIKLGYQTAMKGYINGGVNHVVVITDGAFNRESDDYEKYVKKYKKKGINLSIVGIQNKPTDEEKMKTAAELGGGTYIPILGLADAQYNLKQAIRLLTFKK